ncbi:ribosome biogenesis factor YjgA [Wenzhouxiangella marina]|uniref:Dual-action ribosomal maturation protein DarP n=1 Tax=Wenzhouxiangella marina TaxID=1579979 RepID=A0A0K0XUB7_9GAMM|nr:ribosome biogenesis factor YjgA [Wenzhouxiangella marina]AKS41309.1 hypothetical protein WM2015_928 [Wenzhouxiangella marina]MBB6086941.1 ribosome-associated protein [Wenzhouxiangella marina]
MARRSRMKIRRAPEPNEGHGGESSPDLGPSKSELKRQSLALQKLGVAVSELPPSRRKAIDMPEDLREAIEAYARITAHGARKRQMQYLGKLIRGIDPTPLKEAVEAFAAGRAVESARLHEVERWRDRLIHEDDALTEWLDSYPGSDVQHLRSLIRQARKDHAGQDPEQRQPKSFRDLFAFLRSILEASR